MTHETANPASPSSPRRSSVSDDVHALNAYFETINGLYHQVSSSLGISDNAFSILYALYEYGGLSQRQLGDKAFIPKQTVSYTVKRLREDGLVSEEAISGRESRVTLTEKGHKVAQKSVTRVTEAERQAMQSFDDRDREAAIALFGSYVERLRAAFDDAGLLA